MTQWKQPWREEFVGLRHDGRKSTDGRVEGFTPDGAVVWIRPTGGLDRVTIHRDDGFHIWRVDSRAIQIKFAGRANRASAPITRSRITRKISQTDSSPFRIDLPLDLCLGIQELFLSSSFNICGSGSFISRGTASFLRASEK
jgi:hypothetical protein